MKYLLGVDDTDNLESRGTGHRVRELADWLISNQVAEPQGITRHQLLVDPRIPYTSHNSSACIVLDTTQEDSVWELSREFLKEHSADGSDVGLCMTTWDSIADEVIVFGQRAKLEVLTMLEA